MSRITFKISPYLREILDKISANQITQISTPTGTGKSLAIPEALYHGGSQIFTAVPTIVATLNLYNTTKNLLKIKNVGYAADAKINYNEKTQLVYATYGHAINFLQRRIQNSNKENPFDFCTHLILDEVHMGTAEMVMIFAYYLHFMKQYERMPRLIMMSATLSGMNLLKNYDIVNWPDSESVFASELPYKYKYEETDICFLQSNKAKTEAMIQTILHYHDNTSIARYGDILVFVAGELDIKQITDKLLKQKRENLLVMNLMSTTEQEDLRYINMEAPEGFRKVIISTNVAETGVTVEGIGIVIDSMEAKISMTSTSGGFLLKRDIISRANAIQRAGRCARAPFPGRSFPDGGIVHRLVTRATFEDSRRFAAFLPNEMVRTPIFNHVLNIYSIGLNPTQLELQTTPETLTTADTLLNRYQLLDEFHKVTASGKFVVKCPLTIDMATVLYNVLHNFHESNGVDPNQQLSGIVSIACVISSCDRGYLMNPKDPEEQQSAREIHRKYESSSTLETMCLVLNDYLQTKKKLHSKMAIYKWCKKNYISAKEFLDLCRSIRLTLLMCNRKFLYQPFNFESAMRLFYPYLTQVKSAYLMENTQARYYNYVQNSLPSEKYTLNTFNSIVNVDMTRRIYALLIKSFNDNGIYTHRVIAWIYEKQASQVVKRKVAPARLYIAPPVNPNPISIVESMQVAAISVPAPSTSTKFMEGW